MAKWLNFYNQHFPQTDRSLADSVNVVSSNYTVSTLAVQSLHVQPIMADSACFKAHQSSSLKVIVEKCCNGNEAKAQQVIDNLLSLEDKQDIIDGNVSPECLRAHIEVWFNQGMKYYSTRETKR